MLQPLKLALGLGLTDEMMLKTFNLKPSHYFFIIHLSIRARFICYNYAKLALSLGPANEIILKTFYLKPFHYSFILLFFYYLFIHSFIRVRFV